MKRFFVLLIIIPFVYGGYGGGGSGGGQETTSTERNTFILKDPDRWNQGYKVLISMTGSASTGERFEYAANIEGQEETIYGGTSVIPVFQMVLLEDPNSAAFISISSTCYYNADTKEPIIEIDDDGNESYPENISKLPETGMVGDFGSLTKWVNSDGTYYMSLIVRIRTEFRISG